MNMQARQLPRTVNPLLASGQRCWIFAICAMPLAMSGCQVPGQGLKPPPQFMEPPPAAAEQVPAPFQAPADSLASQTETLEDFLRFAGADTVTFAPRSTQLDASARQILARQAEWLIAHPAVSVVIEGHSDERVSVPEAFTLSEQRANAVRRFLTANGMATHRIRLLAGGRMLPRAAGHDEASWQQNRRARTHLILAPVRENRP